MLKKVSQTTPTSAQIVDGYNTSTTDGYSSNYINNAFGGKILWTNPNPSSAMASNTTITLSSNDYNVLECYFALDKTDTNDIACAKAIKGKNLQLTMNNYGNNGIGAYMRSIVYSNDTTYTVGASRYSSGSNTGSNNDNIIPLYIIGYKTSLFD